MSLTNTDIQLKRSVNEYSDLANPDGNDQQILYGEPIFIDNTESLDTDGNLSTPCKAYIAVGRKNVNDNPGVLSKSPVIKLFTKDRSDHIVFTATNEEGKEILIDEAGKEIASNRISTIPIDIESLNGNSDIKFHILAQANDDDTVYKFTLDDLGIYINHRGIMHGAAWNDYAEVRKIKGEGAPGLVVCDSGNLILSSERLQPCAHVISDTYGHLLGELTEETVPIAVAGRVLVAMDYTVIDIKVGDCVCAGQNGLASKMTRQEIINYPDRILGTVCEIPTYNNIGSLDIDDRIWINVK